VRLPLLFGIITYLLVIFFLTAWLTKYHKYQCRGTEPEDHLETREEYFSNESIIPETKDSQTPTSGKQDPQ
jgi:hypothetical protein